MDYSKFICYQKIQKRGPIRIIRDTLCGLLTSDKKSLYKWIDYNTFETKTTMIPKTYIKHKVRKDIVEKYYCGSKQRIMKMNEEYTAIQSKVKGMKHYFIHDNYMRPFLVYLDSTAVHIYKVPENQYALRKDTSKYDNKNKWMYIEHIMTISNPVQYWIGKSPKNDRTAFSCGYGKRFDGNSIVVQKDATTYVYIGSEIYSFQLKHPTQNKIVSYLSHVGNNDVPYPYIQDAFGDYYLMLDKIWLHIPENAQLSKEYYDSIDKKVIPYNVYYFDKENKMIQSKPMTHIHMIQEREF
jgi:hypothetical protein